MSDEPDRSRAGSPRPSVRLDPPTAWEVVRQAHTGIFTSLRADGWPVALPLWFVVEGEVIWLSTLRSSKKAVRVRHDPRTSFLVESGLRWAELRAVHFSCTATVVEGERAVWVDDQKAAKYEGFGTRRRELPAASRDHYAAERVAIRLIPDERFLSWDNARVGKG